MTLPMMHPVSPFARAKLGGPLPRPSEPLLDRLWSRYVTDVPHVRVFTSLCGGVFENDHVAFRSLGRAGDGIALFAPIFERRGWKRGGHYTFPDVHLRAVHLTRPGYPRIFLSELTLDALPQGAAAVLARMPLPPQVPTDLAALAAWFCEPPPPSAADLDTVARVSQYGAWLLAFGRRVNHFTARVDDVAVWQERMRAAGVPMKGEIEGAPGGDLRQTATAASSLDVVLRDGGTRSMPYAYFEIAERHRGFDGFLGPQARQLFDMTKPPSAPRGVELRKHERHSVAFQVELTYGGLRVPVTTENISLGGVFLQLPEDEMPRVHDVLEMTIALPSGDSVRAVGVVVYLVPTRGAGVEFTWWGDGDDADSARERNTLARVLNAE